VKDANNSIINDINILSQNRSIDEHDLHNSIQPGAYALTNNALDIYAQQRTITPSEQSRPYHLPMTPPLGQDDSLIIDPAELVA